MSKKQILALFFCSLVPWTVGNGLVPLLPVYAARLGANSAVAGYYLGFSYLALACGALAAGWVSDRLKRRKLPLIIAGLVSVPIAWLMGYTTNIWSLTALTALLWLFGGLGLSLIGILAGLSADESERGKIFGILSLTGGMGALIGGLTTGAIVDHWGYPALFTLLAVFLIIWPAAGLFVTEKEVTRSTQEGGAETQKTSLGRNFYLLFTSTLAASIAGFTILLGRSLFMNEHGFDATAIASTGAAGGLIAIPLPLLAGWLSDRQGRKTFLYFGLLSSLAGLLILAFSSQLWHFWIVVLLYTVSTSMNGAIGNALVTDLVPKASLGKGLALFGATGWIGGVIGFTGAGLALQKLGVPPTFAIGSCLILIAIGLVIPIRSKNS